MIPWPIALIAVLFAIVAAVSAASVCKIASGAVHHPVLWPAAWLALSTAVICGLVLLRPWARRAAVLGLILMTLLGLAVASLLVLAGRPGAALAATVITAVFLVTIRYLRRPGVKAYFGVGTVAGGR